MFSPVKYLSTRYFAIGVRKQLHYAQRDFAHFNDRHSYKLQTCIAAALFVMAGLLYLINGYHTGFHTLNDLTPLAYASFWQMLTFIGDTTVALCLMLFFARRNPAIIWVVFIAAIYGTIVTHSLKPYFDALRPAAVLAQEDFNLIGQAFHNRSFPSGHSLTIFILIGILFHFARQTAIRTLLVIFGLSVAFSRVMVAAHWPVDVLVGGGLGILVALLSISTAKRWHWGFRPTAHWFILSLLLIATIMLYFHTGGYPQTRIFSALLATSALAFFISEYFVSPYAATRRQPVSRES